MCGDSARSPAQFPEDEEKTRIKRRSLKSESNPGKRFRGVREIPIQGPTKRNCGVIKTVRRGPQSPHTAILPGIPLAWSTYVNLTAKAPHLGTGVLDTRTPNRPFPLSPQGDQLQMGRSPAHVSRNIHPAIAHIRARVALRHYPRFDRFRAFYLSQGQHLARVHSIIRLGTHFQRRGDLELVHASNPRSLALLIRSACERSSLPVNSWPEIRLRSAATRADNADPPTPKQRELRDPSPTAH